MGNINEVIDKLSPLERKIVPFLKLGIEEIEKKTELDNVSVLRALRFLESKGLLKVTAEVKKIIELGVNGVYYKKNHLPERRLLILLETHNHISLDEAAKLSKLSDNEFKVSLGVLKGKAMINLSNGKLGKDNSVVNVTVDPLTREEAEKLYDNIYNLRQFLSGRTFWVGGTKVAQKYPCANFNCAFIILNNIKSFEELFYLLMVGTGVGVRVLKSDVNKLPKIRNNIEIIHKEYNSLPKKKREDNTSLEFKKDIAKIIIGDSKEGWSKALFYYLDLLTNSYYENIKLIIFDYDNVRPKGERLKTFGGTASGHESIKNMFKKIHIIII